MAKHRTKEEKLNRIRLGSRYFGFNLAQFYWECLKQVAASEELTETDILRRIIGSWSETLPPTIQETARAETTRVEAWKTQELRARRNAKLQAKQAKLNTRSARSRKKGLQKFHTQEEPRTRLLPEPMMGLPVAKAGCNSG
jgi:predicted DNA-binding ribbon-helix-helix protein